MTIPPRKRFQIHLSTAIVMMFVAGGLIWANLSGQTYAYGNPEMLGLHGEVYSAEHPYSFVLGTRYGWPLHSLIVWEYKYISPFEPNTYKREYVQDNAMFVIDLSIALIILFAAWYLCEWLIRRRAARKGA